jgi:hypothetical protein
MGACCGKQAKKNLLDREQPLISGHEREDSIELLAPRKRLEKNLRFNEDKEVIMEGILTLKKKSSLLNSKQEGFCTLIGTSFQMFGPGINSPDNAPPPTVEAVITSVRDWDEELCGLIAGCADGRELFLRAPNQFELGIWGRGMAIAIDPNGTEALELRKELRKAKKKSKRKEDEKLKKLAEMSAREKKRVDAYANTETERLKSEDSKAQEEEDLKKGRAEARKKAQERAKSSHGLRKRNKGKAGQSRPGSFSPAPAPAPSPGPSPAPLVPATTTSAAAEVAAGSSSSGGPKFAPYVKMQKCGLPEGPIRQKMSADGVGDADITSFFSGGVAAAAAPVAAAAAASPLQKTAGRSALLGDIAARRIE